MKNTLEAAVLIVTIMIGGLWWWSQVRENDRRLEETARCANAVGEPGTKEWRKAWDACFETITQGTPHETK